MVLTVQDPQSNGQKLVVLIKTDTPRYWSEFPNVEKLKLNIVTPSVVSQIIESAQEFAWQPKSKSAPLKLMLGDDQKLSGCSN